MNKNRKLVFAVLITFISTLLLSVSATLFYVSNHDVYDRLRKVTSLIEKNYVGKFDIKKAEEAAIESVVESTGDKYAVYYNEKNAQETMDYIDGYYVGIGLEVAVNTEDGTLEIISAYEQSPAYNAGIKSGDVLYSINGKKYGVKTFADAAAMMRGSTLKNPIGTNVDLVILRNGKKLEFSVKREKIETNRVTSKLTADGMCYIRYSGFAQNSEKKLAKIIEETDKDKTKGIVIDLRDNPGGEFDSAIAMCDLFLDDGVIMYTKDKAGKKTVYSAKKGSCDIPLAVLVNEGSASASEIFAGSMKARKRAIIVGEKTYGKGVSQTISYINVLDRSDGALKLTVCKNYLSDDTWLNEGVTPDVLAKDEIHDAKLIEQDAVYKAAVASIKNNSKEQ